MELRLHSPAGAEPVVYSWPLTTSSSVINPAYSICSIRLKIATENDIRPFVLLKLCSPIA